MFVLNADIRFSFLTIFDQYNGRTRLFSNTVDKKS